MASAKDLYVNLVARTQQFGAQLRSAGQSLRNFGDQAQSTSQRTAGAFDTIGNAAKAYIGVQGVRAMYDAAMAAGALQDSIAATDRVFGTAAGKIGEAADDSAQRWGLTEQQFRQMAVNTGQQLQNFGFSADEAADATLRLTDRARDMASNAGLPMQQAIDAIGAALRGERDPIEQFGVSIKQADINARLAAKGLSDLTGEARKTAEAQVAIDAIFEQSANTVGSFSESSTADVQQLQAAMGDLKATIGEDLLPVINDLAGALGELEPVFDVVGDAYGKLQSLGEFTSTPLRNLLGLNDDASDSAYHLSAATLAAATAMSEMGVQADSAGGKTEAAGGAATRAGNRFAGAAAGVNTFAGALARIAGNVFSSVDATSRANSAIQSYNTLVSGSGGGGGGGGAAGATRNLGEEQKKAAQNARRMQEASEDLADAQADLLELETELADLRGSLADKNLEERKDAEGKLEDANIDSRSAALDLKDAEDDLERVRKDSESTARDIERAEIALDRAKRRVQESALRVAEAEEEVKQKRRGNTDAAKELQEAEEAVADAQERVEDATLKAGDAYVQAIKPAKDLTSALGGGGGGGGLAAAAWEVEAAAADAAREVVDAARDFLGFRDDALLTRDATQAWIDKIDELAQDVAPGSPLRRYLDELVGVLENLRRTAPTVLGDRLGAPVGGVPGRQEQTLGGSTVNVKLDLDGRTLAEKLVELQRNSGGFITP